jgi:hypothetical protein
MSGIAAALMMLTTTAGCGHQSPLGPRTPTGATNLGGPAVTSASPPPPGWTTHPAIPTSQQQAQDTILGYLKKTLQALPPGTALDATRYSGATNTPPCKDVETGKPPVSLTTIGELNLPAGVDPVGVVARLGDTWKSGAGTSLSATASENPTASVMPQTDTSSRSLPKTQ